MAGIDRGITVGKSEGMKMNPRLFYGIIILTWVLGLKTLTDPDFVIVLYTLRDNTCFLAVHTGMARQF